MLNYDIFTEIFKQIKCPQDYLYLGLTSKKMFELGEINEMHAKFLKVVDKDDWRYYVNIYTNKKEGMCLRANSSQFNSPLARWYYEKGKKHGKFTSWWDKDCVTLREQFNYVSGKMHGIYRMWHEEVNVFGTINNYQWFEYYYVNGKKMKAEKEWHDNGALRYEINKKGYKEYCDNGNLEEEGTIQKQGKSRIYHKTKYHGNGKISMKYTEVDNMRQGMLEEYDNFGKCTSRKLYMDGIIIKTF